MVDVALILFTGSAVGLGCIHSWRYLRWVREAEEGDRAAQELAIRQLRREVSRAKRSSADVLHASRE